MALAMPKSNQREPLRKPRSLSKFLSSVYSGMKRRAADESAADSHEENFSGDELCQPPVIALSEH
jgi:hypothetical protein